MREQRCAPVRPANGPFAFAGALAAAFALAVPALAQPLPLAPVSGTGQTVTPAYEGWYVDRDGSYVLSFGYYNRNAEEVVEIPVGPDNFVSPGEAYRGQPTRFEPRRHWGVFTVKVPPDFGNGKVVWTLKVRGETFAIPGHLNPKWEIDALAGEAGSGNTPPVLRFAPNGPVGQGPAGVTAGPLQATVGTPLTLSVFASDDGKRSGSIASDGREDVPVRLTWFKHSGPGEVSFAEESPDVGEADGKATTTATFAVPGDYVLRVRANDASGVSGAGHAQCCWTNGFVKVTVSR